MTTDAAEMTGVGGASDTIITGGRPAETEVVGALAGATKAADDATVAARDVLPAASERGTTETLDDGGGGDRTATGATGRAAALETAISRGRWAAGGATGARVDGADTATAV
jgi:hypothetical protein